MEQDSFQKKHYELESVTSKRYSLGEVLAAMQPEHEDEFERKYGPPVDFSFKEIRQFSKVARAVPRLGPHSYITVPVTLPDDQNMPSVTPSVEGKDESKSGQIHKKHVKYCSKAIRLSNNSLRSFDGFGVAMQAVLDCVDTLEWIDLSFNDLPKISEALLQCSMLKVLYLHANVIDDIHQIDKLATLSNLKTLTLHGNMIDNRKGYRQYVINKIPQLQYLDFSRITKADRDKAKAWVTLKIIGGSTKKKKAKIED